MKTGRKKAVLKCGLIFIFTIAVIWVGGLGINAYQQAQEAVQVVSERVVVPGGQSVGIRMNVKGVLVVGLEEIETENAVVSPGYLAGMQIGDKILSINGQPVTVAADVDRIVNDQKAPLHITVLRKNEELDLKVVPVKHHQDGRYKIGVWVKEKIAGIGTLSFYDPQTNVYAALGHGIYESKTNTLLESAAGTLLPTEVKSIREGTAGKPGEIRGIFYGDETPMGEVRTNGEYGVYAEGTTYDEHVQPVIMATQEQVKEGPAEMLTTINGKQVERFSIEIVRVNPQKAPSGKGLEIKVTDPRLLNYSGGIVQGMSGSPILQNNRFVGAVTHVFVNNPTKGYGIFAEWMIRECQKIAGDTK